MNKTNIEWTDFTWGPVTGCLKRCPFCYANALANGRLKERYLANKNVMAGDPSDPFAPRSWPSRFEYKHLRVPAKYQSKNPALPLGSAMIFTVSMGDLLGPWVEEDIIMQVIDIALNHPQHIFHFLTKFPENLAHWNPWPENAWVGASIGSSSDARGRHVSEFIEGVKAPVRFISAEPLLGEFVGMIPHWLDWIIIGAETGNRKGKPALADVHCWAGEIIEAADLAGVPVFLKDNLHWPTQRREWPECHAEQARV